MEKARWLRCSSLTDRWRVCSFVTPRHQAFSAKTGPHRIFKQALRLGQLDPDYFTGPVDRACIQAMSRLFGDGTFSGMYV